MKRDATCFLTLCAAFYSALITVHLICDSKKKKTLVKLPTCKQALTERYFQSRLFKKTNTVAI